jgi:hypothetical protein
VVKCELPVRSRLSEIRNQVLDPLSYGALPLAIEDWGAVWTSVRVGPLASFILDVFDFYHGERALEKCASGFSEIEARGEQRKWAVAFGP